MRNWLKIAWSQQRWILQTICCFTLRWQFNSATASVRLLLSVMAVFEESVQEVWKLECNFINIQAK